MQNALFSEKKILIMSAHVGSRLIFFLSVVGIFLLVLSVVSKNFSPFVANRLTPFRPSQNHRSAKKCFSSRVIIATNVLDTYNTARRVETASLLEPHKSCL